MIILFQKLAKYNSDSNNQLFAILESQTFNIFDHAHNGYFKNIHAILEHVISVDISWLHDLKKYFPHTALKSKIIKDIPEDETRFLNLSRLKNARFKIDAIITNLCNELLEEDLLNEIVFKDRNNIDASRSVWEILIHIFNHQTHHRGQISLILDESKIANDYSNLIRIL